MFLSIIYYTTHSLQLDIVFIILLKVTADIWNFYRIRRMILRHKIELWKSYEIVQITKNSKENQLGGHTPLCFSMYGRVLWRQQGILKWVTEKQVCVCLAYWFSNRLLTWWGRLVLQTNDDTKDGQLCKTINKVDQNSAQTKCKFTSVTLVKVTTEDLFLIFRNKEYSEITIMEH